MRPMKKFGPHIIQKPFQPLRTPNICPRIVAAQYMTEMMIPKIIPSVCPSRFPNMSARGKAIIAKNIEPNGIENFFANSKL